MKIVFWGAAEAVVLRCSVKKVFLEISKNSQENTCARVSLLEGDSGAGVSPVNFAKFLRKSFLKNTSGRLLLLLTHFMPLSGCIKRDK